MIFVVYGEVERVQVILFSYYNNDICVLVMLFFVFDYNSIYFLVCFLVESVYNIVLLEDFEFIKLDRFDFGEEDFDMLDQWLYFVFRYLEIFEWWYLFGFNFFVGKY